MPSTVIRETIPEMQERLAALVAQAKQAVMEFQAIGVPVSITLNLHFTTQERSKGRQDERGR